MNTKYTIEKGVEQWDQRGRPPHPLRELVGKMEITDSIGKLGMYHAYSARDWLKAAGKRGRVRKAEDGTYRLWRTE